MNTLLLRIGCFFLFGFIFFQSFHTSLNDDPKQLLGQQKKKVIIEQSTVAIGVDAQYSSVVDYETKNSYAEQLENMAKQ